MFRGGRTWIASPDGSSLARTTNVDTGLVGGLRKAHALIADGAEQGLTQSYHRYMARLAFLAPDIQQAIVEGRQPAGLTLERLLKENRAARLVGAAFAAWVPGGGLTSRIERIRRVSGRRQAPADSPRIFP